jgi:acyl transferase domain-containing protein/acyl carrier protein
VIEYALARLWMEWGVQPQAMIGYSLGEYVAACLAGVFSIQDALTLLAHRALLIETLPPGAMVAVPLSVADVQPFLDHQVDVAAINAPNLCVVAGSTAAIENLEHQLIQKGIACRRVQTTHPFHSTHMLPITDRLLQQISQLSLNPPRIPFISNTSGTWITPQEATDHAYWARHIAHPVRFADGIGELLQESDRIFLEVGPGQSLRGFVLQQMTAEQAAEQVVVTSMSHRYDQQPDLALLLTTVGQLWLSGVEIAWHRMYKHEQRRRCSLPTYAFEGERYWIEAAPERVAVSREDLVASKAPDMSQWFYLPSWKKSLLPLPVGQAASEQQRTQNWLVFLDEIGIGARIAQHLQQHGQHVVTIDVGETFLAEAPNHYRIDLHQPNSYDDLVRQLHAIEQIPDNVVHLWSVTPYAEISGDAESFERLQGRGFYSLLFLTQSLMKQHVTKAVNVYMVSNSMQHVAGEDMLFPEKATLLGPCKSISQEYPHITCRSIDITLPGAGAVSLETVIDQLLAEVHGASNDLVVAYRGWDRWTQIFEQVAVPAPKSVPAKLKQGSAWLISGGLGSVGFALSHYLARTIRPTLFLTSRSTLPERDQWDVYLQTHAAHDKTCRAINKLRALEAAGATVEVVTADIADTQAMRAVVERLRQTVGGLEGVIHAAGIVEGDSIRPISELTPADCAAQFRPKAYGLYVLEQVLQDIPIKYCFLTSSLSPILGGIGLTAYAAANVFMDAFVHKHNRTQASLWTTVNWEGWQFDKGDQTLDGFGETLARLAISAEEGQAAFERVLSLGSLSQVIISTGDLQARIDQWVKLVSIRAADAPATTEESKRYPRPKLLTAYVAPRNTTEHTLVSMWQELLGIEQIGIHDNFFQLGGHSLLGIQVVSRVRVQFRVELPLRTLFESATIADLAKIIIKIQIEQYRGEDLSVLIAEIEQLSDEEVDEILFQGHQQGD